MTSFSKWKTIGYAVAIFVTGGISGGAIGLYEARSRPELPPGQQEMALRIIAHLQTRLGLTPDQTAHIRPVIDRAAYELRSIRSDTAQRINKVFDESYAQVSAILTPDQRVKLDELQKKRREAMQARLDGHWHPGGPGGPGGARHDSDDGDHDHGSPPGSPHPAPSAS